MISLHASPSIIILKEGHGPFVLFQRDWGAAQRIGNDTEIRAAAGAELQIFVIVRAAAWTVHGHARWFCAGSEAPSSSR